jgi:uncharacterized protein (DUF1800 family)
MSYKIGKAWQSRVGNIKEGIDTIAEIIREKAISANFSKNQTIHVAMLPNGDVYAPHSSSYFSIAEVWRDGSEVGVYNKSANADHIADDLRHVASEWRIAA